MLHTRIDGDEQDARAMVERLKYDIADFGEILGRWGDVLSDQDPSPMRARKHRRVYARLHTGRQHMLHDANAERFDEDEPWIDLLPIRSGEPVDFPGMIDIVARAARKYDVPFAWQMMRLALRSIVIEEYRIAVTEAGTAAELALAALYTAHVRGQNLPSPDMSKWTLGAFIHNYAKTGGPLPSSVTKDELVSDLLDVRNDAIHRGRTTPNAALGAIRLAELLVRAAYPVTYEEGPHLQARGNFTDLVPIGPKGQSFVLREYQGEMRVIAEEEESDDV